MARWFVAECECVCKFNSQKETEWYAKFAAIIGERNEGKILEVSPIEMFI